MKTKTRIAAMAAACLLLVSSLAALAGCSGQPEGSNGSTTPSTGKLTIMTTLFPQYDFARQVAGEHAEVSLLLPLGMESHSYEPTPADVVQIGKSDLFIYTGNYMEGWVSGILDNAASDSLTVLDVSKGIELDVEGEDGHDHHANDGHQHEYDPHIWTSPVLAKQMVENIAQTLCYIDPEHAADYQANARAYQEKLDALDGEIRQVVADGQRKKVFFGGTFPFHYFFEEYGLEYEAAYDSCSGETEPSAGVVAHMIEEMRQENIPVIYHEELVDPKIARSIADETGASMLLFHSCHNVSRDDFERGVTYLELMHQNAENLKQGLGSRTDV